MYVFELKTQRDVRKSDGAGTHHTCARESSTTQQAHHTKYIHSLHMPQRRSRNIPHMHVARDQQQQITLSVVVHQRKKQNPSYDSDKSRDIFLCPEKVPNSITFVLDFSLPASLLFLWQIAAFFVSGAEACRVSGIISSANPKNSIIILL